MPNLAPAVDGMSREAPSRDGGRRRRWVVVLMLAWVVGGWAAGAGAESPAPAPRLISARGTGRVALKPDTAIVRLGAETRAPTVAAATGDVAQRSTAVIERLKSLGVAERDIATVSYS